MTHSKLTSITVTILAILFAILVVALAGNDDGDDDDDGGGPPTAQEPLASWSEIISNSADRFVAVLDNDEGILDRETGLVWEKTPDNALANAVISATTCYNKIVGNRFGWRLPTASELASLIDTSQNPPKLPPGHPFVGVLSTETDFYYVSNPTRIGETVLTVNFNFGTVNSNQGANDSRPSWCVRGR